MAVDVRLEDSTSALLGPLIHSWEEQTPCPAGASRASATVNQAAFARPEITSANCCQGAAHVGADDLRAPPDRGGRRG
ncbi:hypothetical protein [Saccharopolyspora hattusasensis]|uniref:hypothetical protein n=1 Tax=Saccharopolyspora hattusasensis TaxID=1128679 RepID=UPI003D98333F